MYKIHNGINNIKKSYHAVVTHVLFTLLSTKAHHEEKYLNDKLRKT